MRMRAVRTPRVGGLAGLTTAMLLAMLVLGWQAPPGNAQKDKGKGKGQDKVGLILNESAACKGYTLIAPLNSRDTYMIDMQGRVVNTWKGVSNPAASVYLLENGNLLRTGSIRKPPFNGAGFGGRIQEFTWDGKLVWDYSFSNPRQMPHHDICRLPNGNILMIVAEKMTAKDVLAAGRRPETVKDHLVTDCILEVKPTGKTSGEIVWQWRAWDHLIQEFDKAKANFGDVGKHPERIDVNFGENTIGAMVAKPSELKKLQALGYVGGTNRKPGRISPDWLHVNAVAYNAELDQIMLSVHQFSEIWVIDHGTTTKEAASEKGGKWGKGGGLLYRWGNPRAYRAGGVKDQKLFSQHNAHWIPKGYPGEGNVLVFNNGIRRIGGAHSSVDEIVPPWNQKSGYALESGKAYGPDRPVWSYAAPKKHEFYAWFISGAQRLSNGNTLVCSGPNATVFEVTAKKEIVWKYVNPIVGGGRLSPPSSAPPRLVQLLPWPLPDTLEFSAAQKKDLTAIEKGIEEKLVKLLDDGQKKALKERHSRPDGSPRPGQLLSDSVVRRLKLSDTQKKELAGLQKDADGRLDKILKDDQKKKLEGMRKAKGPPGGGAPPSVGGLFRAPRYEVGYPGLPKDLKPGKPLADVLTKMPPKAPKDRK